MLLPYFGNDNLLVSHNSFVLYITWNMLWANNPIAAPGLAWPGCESLVLLNGSSATINRHSAATWVKVQDSSITIRSKSQLLTD